MQAIFWPVWISWRIKKILLNRLHMGPTLIFTFYLTRQVVIFGPHFTPSFFYSFLIGFNKPILGCCWWIRKNGGNLRFLIFIAVILLCIELILQPLRSDGTSYRLRIFLKGGIILNDSAIAILVLALMSMFFSFRDIYFLRCILRCNRWFHLI